MRFFAKAGKCFGKVMYSLIHSVVLYKKATKFMFSVRNWAITVN